MYQKNKAKKTKNSALTALLCLGLPFLSSSYAQNQRATDSVWKDKKTHLVWQRCNVGEQWDGRQCQGKAARLTWDTVATYVKQVNEKTGGGRGRWRLPTIDELATLRRCSKGWMKVTRNQSVHPMIVSTVIHNQRGSIQLLPVHCKRGSFAPTVNPRLFPTAKDAFYWTSSETNENFMVLGVDFRHGIVRSSSKALRAYARLVRRDK